MTDKHYCHYLRRTLKWLPVLDVRLTGKGVYDLTGSGYIILNGDYTDLITGKTYSGKTHISPYGVWC